MKEHIITGPKTGAGRRIDRIWAVAVTLDDGDESIPVVYGPDGQPMPLIASDEARLAIIIQRARRWARASGKPVRLVKFQGVELVETIHPDGRRERP